MDDHSKQSCFSCGQPSESGASNCIHCGVDLNGILKPNKPSETAIVCRTGIFDDFGPEQLQALVADVNAIAKGHESAASSILVREAGLPTIRAMQTLIAAAAQRQVDRKTLELEMRSLGFSDTAANLFSTLDTKKVENYGHRVSDQVEGCISTIIGLVIMFFLAWAIRSCFGGR